MVSVILQTEKNMLKQGRRAIASQRLDLSVPQVWMAAMTVSAKEQE